MGEGGCHACSVRAACGRRGDHVVCKGVLLRGGNHFLSLTRLMQTVVGDVRGRSVDASEELAETRKL